MCGTSDSLIEVSEGAAERAGRDAQRFKSDACAVGAMIDAGPSNACGAGVRGWRATSDQCRPASQALLTVRAAAQQAQMAGVV